MWQKDVVSYNVWLRGWIPPLTKKMAHNRAPSRSLNTGIVTLNWETTRFVESDPVFHSVSKSLEASEGIMLEVLSVSDSFAFCKAWVSSQKNATFSCRVVVHGVSLTQFVCSTILHIYLQASVEDPNDIELHKAGFLIENNGYKLHYCFYFNENKFDFQLIILIYEQPFSSKVSMRQL